VPVFEVEIEEVTSTYTAEDLTTKLFVKLRETAEMFLGKPVDSCVVGYPDHFSAHQQEQLKLVPLSTCY